MKSCRRHKFFVALPVLLTVLSVFSGSLLCALTSKAAEDAGGRSFSAAETHVIAKTFEKAPVTLEAVVSLPEGFQGRGGVILGNYTGSSKCLNFEIFSGGNPRIYYIDENGTGFNYIFKKVDVRGGGPVHIAVVNDAGSGKLLCYKNGVQADSIDGAAAFSELSLKGAMTVGGDRRSSNSEYFKGRISGIVLYDRVRTPEEIAEDAAGRSVFTDALMALDFDDGADKALFPDLSGNGYDAEAVVKWLSSSPPLLDYEFSICLVGDTQKISMRNPRHVSYIYDWICGNIESKKIAFVMHMGDITENSTAKEWEINREEIFKMNGKVGYSLIRGNHDTVEGFDSTFGVPEYMDRLLGTFDGTPANSYQTFSAGGQDFLHVCLDYGAPDAALKWAAGIIEAHPEHLVIITTHCYLYHDGTTLDINDPVPPNYRGTNDGWANNGDQMWDKLMSKYPNIFLVCCGHDPWDDVVVAKQRGDNGNIVTAILANPQDIDLHEGSSGIVTMLYFSRDGKRLQIENYSTIRNKYYIGSTQQTVEMPGFPSYPPKSLNVEIRLGEHLRLVETKAAAEEGSGGEAIGSGGESTGSGGTEAEGGAADEAEAAAVGNAGGVTVSEGVITVNVPFGGAMAELVIEAEEGYCIPEDFLCESIEGVTVTRESFGRIVIKGTPLWHAVFKLGDAEAHVPTGYVRENYIPADCENGGSFDAAVYCERCGGEISRVHLVTPAKGHVFGEYEETRAAACTEDGEETRCCEVCGLRETREIAATGHVLTHHEGRAASADSPGFEDYDTCVNCDYTTFREIPPEGGSGLTGEGDLLLAEEPDGPADAADAHDTRALYGDPIFAADKLRPDTGIREIADNEERDDEPGDGVENDGKKRGKAQ